MREKITREELVQQLEENKTETLILNDIANYQQIGPHRKFQSFDDDLLEALANAIFRNKSMKTFEIRSFGTGQIVSWTEKGAKAVGDALKDHPNLQKIFLNFDSFFGKNAIICPFLNCFLGKSKVKELRLQFLDQGFLLNLADFLARNSSLEYLSIEGSSQGTHEVSQIDNFTQALTQCKNLKKLHLKSVPLQNIGIGFLAKALLSSKESLEILELEQNNFDHLGLLQLIPALKQITSLRILKITNNLIGQGMPELSSALVFMQNLISLHLRKTGLTTLSLIPLVDSLSSPYIAIQELNLSYNPLILQDLVTVRKLIEGNQSLHSLDFNFCEFSDNHLSSLFDLLSNSQKCFLSKFSFSGNQILSPVSYRNMIKILNTNSNLYYLYPPHSTTRLLKAVQDKLSNARASQQVFVNTAMELANGYFSPTEGLNNKSTRNLLPILPIEIISLIMLKLGEGTLGMSPRDISHCSRLILFNYQTRRDLVNRCNETARDSSLTVSKWWQHSLPDYPKRIFRPVTKLRDKKRQSYDLDDIGEMDKLDEFNELEDNEFVSNTNLQSCCSLF